MARPWYERLSILDYAFLAFEGPTTYMHIAGTVIFEAGGFATASGGVDVQRIRNHVAARLARIPRYRQRLSYIPIENHPVWVDDDQFELDYHVRHASLPRPGSDAQLRDLCARLLERPLNRDKPLWEIWVIEGLENGRFALLIKVHHCMVDGLGGVELLGALLSPVPEEDDEAPRPWRPRPAPTGGALLGDEVRRRLRMSADLFQGLRRAVNTPRPQRTEIGRAAAATWRLLRDGVHRPVATPLNQRIGPHRRFHWSVFDLAEVKEIKNQLGGTINDVVLTVVAGAVREFFAHRGFDAADFRVAVPVSVRPTEERTRPGNRISAWIVSLPIHEADPVRRFRAVGELSGELKGTGQAIAGQVLTQAAEWTSANVLSLGALIANQTQPFHLIVTNVPGPSFPLYLLDAPMVALYPLVPLFEGQCLGIALFSYAGKLFWGFNADWDSLPDVDRFARAIEHSFRELRKAAIPRAERPKAASARPRVVKLRPAAPPRLPAGSAG